MRSSLVLTSLVLLTACAKSVDPGQDISGPTTSQEVVSGAVMGAAVNGASVMPNVLFILVDDMGFGDAGYNGSEIATPTLDQLAETGVRLDRNYAYPVCSATRAALLTGHSPLDYGIDGPLGDHTSLPLDLKIMPEYFKDMGYQTYMIGKWHLGIGNTDYWPISRGFDYHYGFLGGWIDFYTHVYSGGLDWQREGQSVREQGHATDLMTDDAVRLISERDVDSPFFMYLSYNAPHSPLQHAPVNSGLNSNIEFGDRSVYAEMVTQVDTGIGKILDTLKSENLLENTIVVFSSDNGGALTTGASNGALAGGKGQAYEGGMRVPGLVWWAGHVEGGRVLEQPVVMHDWLPTLLEAVGGDAAEAFDPYGQSMWGAIARNEQIDRAEFTIGVGASKAAFDWPWKLVRHGHGDSPDLGLFNIVEDPNEANNLADQHPEKVVQLAALLDAIPAVESREPFPGLPKPDSWFNKADGSGKDFELRLAETIEPWAEAAERGELNRGQSDD